MQRTLKSVRVYFDASDPANPGWAYKADYSDSHQESGPLESADWQHAIAEAAADHHLPADATWTDTTDSTFIWEQ